MVYATVKGVSLVDPKTAINMSLGPEKGVVIRNGGTVALSGPTTIDLLKGKVWDQEKVVVLSDRSLSGTLLCYSVYHRIRKL